MGLYVVLGGVMSGMLGIRPKLQTQPRAKNFWGWKIPQHDFHTHHTKIKVVLLFFFSGEYVLCYPIA